MVEEDQQLTTYITLFGRFSYRRGLMGFSATGDAFCQRGDMALQGVTICIKVVDDILLYDEDYCAHLHQIHEVLTRCRKLGITLNPEMFVVAVPSIKFCGYMLSKTGIAASSKKISAVKEFPTPANLTDLSSFMGLVNQLADFSPDFSIAIKPLRPLLSPKSTFVWMLDHDEGFEESCRPFPSHRCSPPSTRPCPLSSRLMPHDFMA